MKILRFCLSSLWLTGALIASANASLNGTWQGQLAVTPSSQVVVQFILQEQDAGDYKAFLNVPNESSLRNVAATDVTLVDDTLTLVIDEVGGKFVGQVHDGAIDGKWTQQGTTFPLVMQPYVKQALPAEVVSALVGEWNGTLNIPRTARQLALVFHIDVNQDNELIASLDSPDQSLSDISFDEVSFRDDFITLKVMDPEMSYHGTLEDGQFVGEWTQGGSAPLNMEKGAYLGRGLDVAASLRDKLRGQWHGQVGSAIALVFRFNDRDDGQFSAFMDSPDQGKYNVPVSAIEEKNGLLEIRVDGYDSVFTGDVSESQIKGTLEQGSQLNELTLARGTYEPPEIILPEEVRDLLLGQWKGKAGETELLFNFVYDNEGEFHAYLDIPAQRLKQLPLAGVSVSNQADKLNFVVKGIGAEFEGSTESNQITGLWTMPGFQFPLQLQKAAR